MEEALSTIPSISLVMPDGMGPTERGGSMEWLDPDGEHFQVQAGLNMAGGTSLGYDKVTYRVHFRSDYGYPRLDFPLYETDDGRYAAGPWPADSFDALTLRSGSHDSVFWLGTRGQYLRNRWMDESMLELGHAVPHGRFAHLYIDGAYVGHYHIREHFNGAFAADYRGGHEDDYSTVNACDTTNGDPTAWRAAVAASSDYEEALRWIDLPNFIDYMLLEFYAANAWDWRDCGNWKAVGPSAPDQGGFQFQAHDADVSLCYACETDILHLTGPGDMFAYLLADGHPDFMSLLADRIHHLLEDGGVLTADEAAARYQRLADLIELSIVAESARWGDGWWERDEDWYAEQDHLFDDFFPCRSETLLQQVRDAGWFPLDAPELDVAPGQVELGTVVTVNPPDGVQAEVYVSTQGDPRMAGGAVSDHASGPLASASVSLDHPTQLRARLRSGQQWGALQQAWYEPSMPTPLLLNEWNAVAEEEEIAGGDTALGSLPGNGGDWLELVVCEDGLDLRGWQLELTTRNGKAGTVVLGEEDVLNGLRAGSIVTVAEEIESDESYDPDAGDWTVQLQASEPFDVDHLDWQLTVHDAQGNIRFGPAGEGVSPLHGVSSRETGVLREDPSSAVRRTDDYGDSDQSTFGAPNTWSGGEQDFTALRYGPGDIHELEDSGPDELEDSAPPPAVAAGGGCGCGGRALPRAWWTLLALLALRRRSGFW